MFRAVRRALFGGRPDDPSTRPKAWLTPEEDALVPPRAIWIGSGDPISHYYRWIWEYLAYLTLLTDLRRDSVVLELGCGHGRTARGLLQYLRSPGQYRGLDVDPVRLADAQSRLQARFPNFQFVRADVYNRQYNPDGKVTSENYVFPFGDATFDVIYAASLFSHLLPAETENYFRQSARVLKPGGRCLFSCFLLDDYQGAGTTISPQYEFEHPLPGFEGVAVKFADLPDAVIGYRRAVIAELARKAGLSIANVFPGLWTNATPWAVNEQDLVLFTRASEWRSPPTP
jgi:SAM-dependent methyltransferase